jgi:hypothetical protein
VDEWDGKANGIRIPENVAIDAAVLFLPVKRAIGRIRVAAAMLIPLTGIEEATAEKN